MWDPPHVFEWMWDSDRLRFELDPRRRRHPAAVHDLDPRRRSPRRRLVSRLPRCFDRLAHLVDTGTPTGIDDDVVKVLESRYADVVREATR